MRTVLFIMFVFFLLSCAATSENTEETDLIKVGMTNAEVKRIMGPPGNYQSMDEQEAWQYCQTNRFSPVNDLILIYFYKRKVTGVKTYYNVGFGACAAFFKSIDWEDAPVSPVKQ